MTPDTSTGPGHDGDLDGTLVEQEGVDAGSERSTDEHDLPAGKDVLGGGDLSKEPPERGDGVSEQEPGLLGSSEADGQDEGSIE